jgi:hypothetical protein
MTDERERLLADLEAIAGSIQDPVKRQEVQRIIARLTRSGASLDLGKPFETVGPLLDLIDQRMRALTLTAGTFPGSISVHSGALHWVT